MSVSGAYELGRVQGEDHYSRVRVYEVRSDPFSGPFEEFLLGEPVYLKDVSFQRAGTRRQTPEDKVWWIKELKEEDGAAFVGVSVSRNSPTKIHVPVTKLEKLPAMVRLAVEYTF